MNRVLTLYIGKQVLQGVLLVMLVLLGISLLFEFLAKLEYVGENGTTYLTILKFILFSIPTVMYDIFSPAVLIGGLMALGGMASNSELIAMRAAGVSKYKITGMVTLTGILLMLMVVLLGETVLPVAEKNKNDLNNQIRGYGTNSGLNNVWLKEGKSFINIGKIVSDTEIENIKVHSLLSSDVTSTTDISSASLQENGQWLGKEVVITDYSNTAVKLERLETSLYTWSFDLSLLEVLSNKPETLSLKSLHGYVSYMDDNNLDSSRYKLSFWLKLFAPFTVLVMLLLALPFAFGSLRSMAAGNLIVIGLVIGLLYYILSGIASHLGHLYGMPPLVNALAPSLVFILLAVFLMMRQKF